jgi:predicted dehydrogenase
LLGLLGPVSRVQAIMGTFVWAIESEDHISANLEFESGAIASICVTGQSNGRNWQQFDLFGNKASAGLSWQIRGVDGAWHNEIEDAMKRRIPDPSEINTNALKRLVGQLGRKLGVEVYPQTNVNSHLSLFREYFSAIEKGEAGPVTGTEGRAAVELCTAIYKAALTGTTVNLPVRSDDKFYSGINKDDYVATITAN